SYSYDAVSRLLSLADNLVGTAYDQTLGFGYTPASQIASNTRSNDAYAWTGHYNVNRNYTANGRNQYTASGSITPTYDAKGNLTSAGTTTYAHTSENLMTSASGSIALAYDPGLRLYQTSGGSAGTTRFAYDGAALIAEYNGSNAMLRRYVHGAGTDEPLVWYEGSGTSERRFLHADERGSVVAVTNSSGTTLNVNGYDEYGIPSSGNVGRFQYTGQTWLPELGMYYYKARIYSPALGRFLQPDPIRYSGGMNIYAYVGTDPVNFADPSGLCETWEHREYFGATHIGTCVANGPGDSGGGSGSGGSGSSGSGGGGGSSGGNVIGGPIAGQPCTNCISQSDPGAQASIKYYGGYYDSGVWVSTNESFFSLFWSSIKNASGLDWLVAFGLSAGLGEEDHATTSDAISTEIEIAVTVSKLERDAAVALIKANPGVAAELRAVWGSGLDDANAAFRNGASRPPGVSNDVLSAYRQSLVYQIDTARDTTGVSNIRLMMIDRWLKQ
ncbi:MAG: RHS repeat-associated core domain-containing protein, partial [Allosphingosinicella sp.]